MWKFWNYEQIPEERQIDTFYERASWMERLSRAHRKHYERFDYIAIKFGRVGFVARGFVWACIGGVSVAAAFTAKDTQGTTGALDVVARNTGGWVIYLLATIGIFSYAAWRLFEGFYGLRISSEDPKWKKFINGYVVPFASFLIYTLFGVSNIYVMIHGRRGTNTHITRDIAKNVVGKIFLNIASILLIGVAFGWVAQLIKGTFKEPLDKKKFDKQPGWLRAIVLATAYIGITGRIFLFLLLAILLFRTTWDHSVTSEGFSGALRQLQHNVAGEIFLVIIGLCLIIFAIWSIFNSYFKQFLRYQPSFRAGARSTHPYPDQTGSADQAKQANQPDVRKHTAQWGHPGIFAQQQQQDAQLPPQVPPDQA
jgi:heme/copper-type cytochrome/quinol oxidase subunit 2